MDLLDLVFEEVIVPPAVHREVTITQPELPDARMVDELPWLRRSAIPAIERATRLPSWFGAGETEVLITEMTLPSPVTLLSDDGGARRVAKGLGFDVVGSSSMLVLAKREGVIREVRPLLHQLIESGLYLSPLHANQILVAADEAT